MEKLEFSPIKQTPRITISFDEKINKGNYESEGVFVSMSLDLDNADDFKAEAKKLAAEVLAIKNELAAGIKKGGSTPITPPAEQMKKGFTPRFNKK